MSKKAQPKEKGLHCRSQLRAMYDTLELLSGKWKIAVIGSLSVLGTCHFMELKREVEGVGAKMLSQVLKELEMNDLVTRTVRNTRPVTVEYSLTPYGKTLEAIVAEMAEWGLRHRERIFKQQVSLN